MLIEKVNPRKLIYFAIDGVAPRAKINQQRSRRFRAGLEIRESRTTKQEIAEELRAQGMTVPDSLLDSNKWDRNVITPGTDFMDRVSDEIRKYIVALLHPSSKFSHLKILFSDSSAPREGEHKILDFIRQQRRQVGYNPNMSHCIYGADADLILLSLSTHEPRFFILRENTKFQPKRSDRGKAMDMLNKQNLRYNTALRFPYSLILVISYYSIVIISFIHIPKYSLKWFLIFIYCDILIYFLFSYILIYFHILSYSNLLIF